jgi:thioredoxin 1
MPRPAKLLALAALGATLAACSSNAEEPRFVAPPTAPAPTVAARAASAQPTGERARLVFFMNPHGAPCQVQDRILRELSGEIAPRVEVVYYKTTEPADIARFQQYGIRALPLLLVTDATGRELRRATPGIQGPDQIRSLIAL